MSPTESDLVTRGSFLVRGTSGEHEEDKEEDFVNTNESCGLASEAGEETKNLNKSEVVMKKIKDLDTILEESVGKFGLFQIWVGVTTIFGLATMAPGIYGSVFTDYTPHHHCMQVEGGTFNSSIWEEEHLRCPSFNNSCQGGVTFDQSLFTSTASSDFSIVCDQAFLKTLSGTLRMSGLLVGSFLFGWLSDLLGRVPSLTLAGILLLVSQVINCFSYNYVMFSVMNSLMAAGGMGTFLVSFVLMFEWSRPEYRTKLGVFAQIPFAVGFLWVVLMGWLFRSWRTLQWVLAAPNLLFLGYPVLCPESPRWLVSRGKVTRAIQGIRVAAKVNRLPAPGPDMIMSGKKESTESQTLLVLVSNSVMRTRLIIMSLNWMVITLCFYGLSLNSANEDLFAGLGSMAAVELLAYLITMLIMDSIGRRPILSVCQLLAGLSCLSAGLVPSSFPLLRLSLALLGKMGASAGFAVVFVYTSEIFHTPVRNSAMGLCSTLARVGALCAPAIADLDSVLPCLPFLIMGGAAVLVGCLSFFLPETRNCVALPETLEEAASIGDREKNTFLLKL